MIGSLRPLRFTFGGWRAGSAITGVIIFLASALSTAVSASAEACPEPAGGHCIEGLTRLMAIAPRPDGGYLAAGDFGPRTLSSGAFIYRLGPDGTPLERQQLFAPQRNEGAAVVDDLVPLDDGSFLVLGRHTVAGRSKVWLGRVDADGWPIWVREPENPDPERDEILYRAIQLRDGRVLAVGRTQTGNDPNYTCEETSVPLVTELPITREDPFLLEEIAFRAEAGRAALYDIAADADGNLLYIGFESRPAEATDRCQDDVIALSARANAPRDFEATRWGRQGTNEVGFAIEDAADISKGAAVLVLSRELVLLTAQTRDDGAPKLEGRPVLPDHILESDPSDGLHAARRVAPGQTLVGGRFDENAGNPTPALAGWMLLGSESATDERRAEWHGRSRIHALAEGVDGRAVAVGEVRYPEAESTVAWISPVYSSVLSSDTSLQPTEAQPLASTAQIDLRGDQMAVLSGALRQGETAVVDVVAGAGEGAGPLSVTVMADGDVDLIVLREDGALLAFSDNKGRAADLAILDPAPHRVTVTLVAREAVQEARLTIAPERGAGDEDIGWDSRHVLHTLLAAEGYRVGPNPTIAVGGQLLRAMAAANSHTTGDFRRGELHPPDGAHENTTTEGRAR